MNRIFILTVLTMTALFAVELPISHAKERMFGESVALNAKVIQLSNAQQAIMSLVSGHIEKYYVQPGQKVKEGQKIALIESIMLSKMTADFISLKKQFIALEKNYKATNTLYEKGMTSMQDVNLQSIQRNAMFAQISALASQLKTLGINTKNLKEASADYVLYAHSSGQVSAILQPLHSVISEDTAIISIVKSQAYYIESYLPLEYASEVKKGQKIVVKYSEEEIVTHITQVLPQLDEVTQRIVVLSSVDEKTEDLFINAYVASTLYFQADHKHVAVEKSALSFFNNEWVVFVLKEQTKENEEHEEHHDEKAEEGEHDEDGEYDEHNEHEMPYEARVVEIVASDDKYVGVKGLEVEQAYVSDKSYYVKSMMLKSSLGEHGH